MLKLILLVEIFIPWVLRVHILYEDTGFCISRLHDSGCTYLDMACQVSFEV